jgi:hypothetical protein
MRATPLRSRLMVQMQNLMVQLHNNQRGAVSVEYLQILLLVVVGAAVAMAPLGVYLLRYYDNVEFVTGLPFP